MISSLDWGGRRKLIGNLNKAVKRNMKRFIKDFMFQLRKEECENLKFQFGTSS